MLKRKCDLDLSSSLHLWWITMSYALTPLTPVWCEVNVLSIYLSIFLFFILFSFCYCLSFFLLSFIYLCFFFFSNTIRPRKIKNEFIGIILIGKRFIRE